MDISAKEVGERIKSKRLKLGLTQTTIKSLTGISAGNMSDIENGNRLPAATTLIQLSNVLECSIDYLLTGNLPISENNFISQLSPKSSQLLELFLSLSDEDKDELLLIAELKYNRARKKKATISYLSEDTEKTNNIA